MEEESQSREEVDHLLEIRLVEEGGIESLEEARQEEETGDRLVEEMEDRLEDLALQGMVALASLVRQVLILSDYGIEQRVARLTRYHSWHTWHTKWWRRNA